MHALPYVSLETLYLVNAVVNYFSVSGKLPTAIPYDLGYTTHTNLEITISKTVRYYRAQLKADFYAAYII